MCRWTREIFCSIAFSVFRTFMSGACVLNQPPISWASELNTHLLHPRFSLLQSISTTPSLPSCSSANPYPSSNWKQHPSTLQHHRSLFFRGKIDQHFDGLSTRIRMPCLAFVEQQLCLVDHPPVEAFHKISIPLSSWLQRLDCHSSEHFLRPSKSLLVASGCSSRPSSLETSITEFSIAGKPLELPMLAYKVMRRSSTFLVYLLIVCSSYATIKQALS